MLKNIQLKGKTAFLVNHLFQTLLVTYLLLLLLEQIWQGSVSTYFNLNYLLVIVILAGILDVFSEHSAQKKQEIKTRDYLFIIALGIAGAVIIFFKTRELGWLSYVISLIAGILIILLSILVLQDDKEEENKQHKYSFIPDYSKLIPALVILSIIILALISLIISILSSLTFLESSRIVFGSVYVLFLPGFIISFIFFPKTKSFDEKDENSDETNQGKAIDWLERIALSFALSIAIVPLVVFYLNLISLRINLLNSTLTILGIIIVSIVILFFRNRKSGLSSY